MHQGISSQAKVYVGTEAIYGISMGIYGFTLNLFLLSRGMEDSQIGFITSMAIVIMGLCALPLGFFAKFTGRKNMYAGGVLVLGAGIAFYVLCPSAYFAIPVIMVALGMTMVEVSEVQVMYQCCTGNEEKLAVFSFSFATFALSSALGIFVAGQLSYILGYAGLLLLASGITICVGVLRWVKLENDRPSLRVRTNKKKVSLRKLIDKRFLSFLAVSALHGALGSTVGPFANLILKYRSNWEDGPVSTVLTLSLLSGFLFALYTPRVQRKRYNRHIYVGLYMASISTYTAMAFVQNIYLLVGLFLLRAGIDIMLKNMIDSVTYLTLKEEQKDIYAGARSLTKGAVGAVTAYLVGLLLFSRRIGMVFVLSAVLMGVALLLFILFIAPILGRQTNNNENAGGTQI